MNFAGRILIKLNYILFQINFNKLSETVSIYQIGASNKKAKR